MQSSFDTGSTASFNEWYLATGESRAIAKQAHAWLSGLTVEGLNKLNQQASELFYQKGVTFTVYHDANTHHQSPPNERIIPLDVIPRVLSLTEWRQIERGCEQRSRALNAFLHDLYHEQAIVKAGIVPAHYIFGHGAYEPWMLDINLPKPVYAHISGIDIIRDEHGNFCVLEDNLRTPSGVAYMLESRSVSEQLLPTLYHAQNVLDVKDYPKRLKSCLASASHVTDPQIVMLTPGRFNSAYYEHAYLAKAMNIPLVQGHELVVEDTNVYLYTLTGKQQVDVIYRRVDDAFLDPLAFRSDSLLGVAGLMSAYRAGNVVLANAPGTAIGDDKSLYPYVPAMIKFYLGEAAILPNVETYQCRDPKQLQHVIANLEQLVVKKTQGSGGYGMLVGPTSTKQQIADYKQRLKANPAGFIAQPTIALSTNPTCIDNEISPRHVDLRPFVLTHGDGSVSIVPGGLTRVAMTKGSLVVNSSQGGGIKDTWVIDDTLLKNHATKPTDPSPTQALKHTQHKAKAFSNLTRSAAHQLLWLGRYGERVAYYQALIDTLQLGSLPKTPLRQMVSDLGLPIELNADTDDETLITTLQQRMAAVCLTIEENVQQCKALISTDTLAHYQQLKRVLADGDIKQAAWHLQRCQDVFANERPLVKLFYQLGRQLEQFERQALLKQSCTSTIPAIAELIAQLPETTLWQQPRRLAKQLLATNERTLYWALSAAITNALSQGNEV